MEVRNRLRENKTYILSGRNLQLFCTKHGIKRLTETSLPLPHRHSITFGREKRQPEIRLLSQTRKEVPNFDFQLIADILKKVNKFRLSIVGRHIKKRYQRSTFNCWERDSNNICFCLKRNKKVPFLSERVFLTNIEKRHHYLVTYHLSMKKNVKIGHILETNTLMLERKLELPEIFTDSHCHSVTRRFPRVKRIFLIYLFFLFRKAHITSVSITVTVSQEGFRMRRVSFLYISFFI